MTIYQKLKKLARNTIKAYHEDLTVHDLRLCNMLKPGNVALWTCREHGTHFIWATHSDDKPDYATLESLRNRLNHFDAVAQVFGNEDGAMSWHVIECLGKPKHGTVFSANAEEARDLMVRRIKSLESYLYRQRAA